MKTFRTIIAFVYALIPFGVLCMVSIGLFLELAAPYHLIFSILVILIGFILARFLFNMMRKRGVIAVLAGNNSTYNLDELSDAAITKHSSKGLADLFALGKLDFNKPATISIWGDWTGRGLDKKHQLKSIVFNEEQNYLTIWFKNNYTIRIKEPQTIITTSDYLKIVKAKTIIWQTPSNYQKHNIYHYMNTSKTIKTKSNTQWKPHSYDIGVGMLALYLQG